MQDIPYYLFRHIDLTHSSLCGLAMLKPGWCHIKRCLDIETVLIIGKNGSAIIEDDGREFEIKENRALLLPATHLHRGTIPATEPLSYWWFHLYQSINLDEELRVFLPKQIESSKAKELLSLPEKNPALFRDGIILPQIMDLSSPELIRNLCGEALQAFVSSTSSYMLYHNTLQKLMLELGKQSVASVSTAQNLNAQNSLVKRILELLESELTNPNASVKYFADALCVNSDYLGRCFKGVMSQPVGQYLTRRRVELACARLRESNKSVEEVAKECGFGSRRQFFDDFKRHTGKTPSMYRSDSAYIGINTL